MEICPLSASHGFELLLGMVCSSPPFSGEAMGERRFERMMAVELVAILNRGNDHDLLLFVDASDQAERGSLKRMDFRPIEVTGIFRLLLLQTARYASAEEFSFDSRPYVGKAKSKKETGTEGVIAGEHLISTGRD